MAHHRARDFIAGARDLRPGLSMDVDFVTFGRTGMGKSTTCNNLIGAQDKKETEYITALEATENIKDIYCSSRETYFMTSDGFESCTKKCKVLSHGPIRVLDVPGFADSEDSKASVCERNLTLIRNVMRVQEDLGLSFYRVLYFMPQRGPLRKIDQHLKDELEVFYSYFGNQIFESMIIVLTKDVSDQDRDINDADLETTRKAVTAALEMVWKKKEAFPKPPVCPPLMYLPFGISTQDLLKKIKDAPVPMDTASATLTIVPNMCTKCGWSVVKVNDEPFQVTNGREAVPFSDSVCHPKIIAKYTLRQKILGGLGHLGTLGFVALYEEISGKETWPGFTNSDEICVNCKEAPGRTPGCIKINVEYTDTYETYPVKHSNQVTRN